MKPKIEHGFVLLFVIIVVLLCVPVAYLVAALIGGVVLIAVLPKAAQYFGVQHKKDNDETP